MSYIFISSLSQHTSDATRASGELLDLAALPSCRKLYVPVIAAMRMSESGVWKSMRANANPLLGGPNFGQAGAQHDTHLSGVRKSAGEKKVR